MKWLLRSWTFRLALVGAIFLASITLLAYGLDVVDEWTNHKNGDLSLNSSLLNMVVLRSAWATRNYFLTDPLTPIKFDTMMLIAFFMNGVIGGLIGGAIGIVADVLTKE